MKTMFGKRSFMIKIAKLNDCSLLKVIFVNRNRCVIPNFSEAVIERSIKSGN